MKSQKESRSFLQKLLQNSPELPFEPTLLPMLFAVTRENSIASTDDLVALVERSQNLTSRVLSLANSAVYGLEFKVSTLHRAISILGIREIRLLVVMAGMASIVQKVKLPGGFDVTALWRHQLTVAFIARTLAAELGAPEGARGDAAKEGDRLGTAPDEAYVAGLLHDIGKVFFAASQPGLWEEVEAHWKESGRHYFEAEDACWGMDHALIGAEVLHHWKLPLSLTEPINWHHAPELAPAHKMETRLLAAANLIAHTGLDAEGSLPAEAAMLLPETSDFAALGTAVADCLANASFEALGTLVQ